MRTTTQPPAFLVINETFAKRFFPGQDPIGKHMQFGAANPSRPWITIVGVVADMHRRGLEKRAVCEGFGPAFPAGMDVIVRSSIAAAEPGPKRSRRSA